ncbi:MAG: NAD(P)-binding protein, partial [Solirubrobacterales bacterium]
MAASSTEVVDFLVVGAGAVGGAISWRLATSGLDVLCLEQGGWADHD